MNNISPLLISNLSFKGPKVVRCKLLPAAELPTLEKLKNMSSKMSYIPSPMMRSSFKARDQNSHKSVNEILIRARVEA